MKVRNNKDLISVEVQPANLKVLDERIAPLLRISADRLNTRIPLYDQLRDIARSAYHQGLCDGAQVGQQMERLQS